jgi:hypothetical protein
MPKGRAIKSKRQWRALWAKSARGEISVAKVRKMTRESKKYRNLAGISIVRCPREGMRVRFNPSGASRALYSYAVPRHGEVGVVTSIALGRGRGTCMKGPGGGLVYVKWPSVGHAGVSAYDLDKVT